MSEMAKQGTGRRLAFGLLALLGMNVCLAAEPVLDPGKPNIFGVWLGTIGPEADPRFRNTPWPAPDFTEWGAAQSKLLMTAKTPDECSPYGPVVYMSGGGFFPVEIARTTVGIVLLLESASNPRRIYMDGRKHPEEIDPTWGGHSIGRWEGDTLVVDTIGSNGRGRPLNGYLSGSVNSRATDNAPRLFVSDKLHLVERIRVVGNGEFLEDELTIDDPKTYKKPFTVKHYWQRRPDLEVLEYFCSDNRRPDAEGHTEDKP
jgi:hypothetical protein